MQCFTVKALTSGEITFHELFLLVCLPLRNQNNGSEIIFRFPKFFSIAASSLKMQAATQQLPQFE
jgi:hypothetical protein